MVAVSIIVPIYNMESYLNKCLVSLLNQTFQDFELLLVDDGSTDKSLAICDKYALIDNRIRVFHKSNGGLSDARNFGLKHSCGEYSIFADPDDWVSPNGLDDLYAKAVETDADMVMCDIWHEDKYARHYRSQKPSNLNHETVLKELFLNLEGFTVNKLIKTSLYKKFNICYPTGLYGCEDQYTMASILKNNIKIEYVPIAFYHYMYNPKSLTRHYDEHTYDMDLHALNMFELLLKDTKAFSIAQKRKKNDIFIRAFWNGKSFYTSKLFKQRFGGYASVVAGVEKRTIIKFAMYLSCYGCYSFAIHSVFILFNFKQVMKKIKFIVTSKYKISMI